MSVPDATTRHSASRSAGIRVAASLKRARTGVTPRVAIIFALVIKAPPQCERSISSGPDNPGKKYLLPPENPHHLVRKHWPNHDRYVGLSDMPVDPYVH